MGRSHTTKEGFQIDAYTLTGCRVLSFDWPNKRVKSINLKPLWSPKQAVMVVVKIYLALVLSLLLYRKVFKNEKKKTKKRSEPKLE